MISPHKDTNMSNMWHGGEMTKGWCYAHIVWWWNSLHMRCDMESCDQSREDQDKAWHDGPVAMVKGKSRLWSEGPRGGEAWARLGTDGSRQRWRAGKVKIDRPKRSCDDMEWIYHSKKIKPSVDSWRWSKGLMKFGACVASTFEKKKWNAQGKGMTCRAFHFTGQRLCREVHDRIYDRWPYYQEGQTCLHIGHLTLRCC